MPHSAVLTRENNPALVLLRRLTHGRRMWEASLPLTLRGVASAFPTSQELGEVLPHILPSKLLPGVCPTGCLRILAGYYVRESVRPRRLRKGRGASYPAFFVALNFARFPMLSSSPAASRPALVPLSRNRIPAREVRHV